MFSGKTETNTPATPATAPVIPTAGSKKPAASEISADLDITGNIKTTGDIQINGKVKCDIRAHLLTIGENVTSMARSP